MNTSLLFNARVLTMASGHSHAQAVAIRDGRIAAAGTEAEAARSLDAGAERVDCQGGLLLPAFIDAHCHLLAYAASLRSVDCSAARSIAEIQVAIRDRAAATPAGQWIRAAGYEETQLQELRHPDRRDLDAAAPGHPVRLIHRSGHASVLNSAALRLAGIDTATEEPPGGVIDRDLEDGEPSGRLIGMEQVIDRAAPAMPYEELAGAVREAAERFLAAGIACIQDATHTNGLSEWRLFERLIADGALPLDVVLMEGYEHMGELPESAAGGRLRRGPVKIMLHELGESIEPNEAELARRVARVHEAGRQVAVHAAGERAVAAAASAIEAAVRSQPRPDHRHRIEHCGLLPDGLATKLAQLGVVVVSQPSFIAERGDRYLQLVPEERQGELYAFRTLRDAGVALAAGSDAPVTPPDSMRSIAAAVDRLSASGAAVAPGQAIDVEDALGWWTVGAARAAFLEEERGGVRPGFPADLVLLSGSGADRSPGGVGTLSIARIWRAGEAVEQAATGSGSA